jgi:predicted DCC family thiol-disulfide oxidoreductase YuxK
LIVVFDAHCLVCSAWVRFLLRHDRRGVFRFASMQGDTGRRLLEQAGLRPDTLQTLLLVDGTATWTHTAAILRVLHTLGGGWRQASRVARLLPAPLRDAAYRFIARHRYRLFGRSPQCLMPAPAQRARFLD